MRKSSAEETHGRRVEDVFKDGFENAEATPPARIWENIDRVLENEELQRYKGQIFWYRSIAAACILLLLAGGVFWWKQDQVNWLSVEQGGRIAQQKTDKSTPSVTKEYNLAPQELAAKDEVPILQDAGLSQLSAKQPENTVESTHLMRETPLELSKNKVVFRNKVSNSLAVNQPKNLVGLDGEVKKEVASNFTPPSVMKAGEYSNVLDVGVIATNESNNGTVLGESKIFNRAALVSSGLVNNDTTTQRQPTILALGNKKESSLSQRPDIAKEEEKEVQAEKNSVRGWSLSAAYASQYAQAPIKLQAPQGNPAPMRASIAQERTNQAYQEAIDEYNQSYSPAYSYSAHVGASYRLNDHWQVESGVLYTQNQSTTSHSYVINGGSGASFFATNGTAEKAEPILVAALAPKSSEAIGAETSLIAKSSLVSVIPSEKYKTMYRFQQVGVPVKVAYRHNMNKVYAFISGGMMINLLLESSINSESNQVQAQRYTFNEDDSPFRNVQWAAITSLGIGYELSTRFTLSLAPELTYSFSSFVKEAKSQPDPYQVGLSIGGKWRLYK